MISGVSGRVLGGPKKPTWKAWKNGAPGHQNRARRAGFKRKLRTTWKAWKNGAPGHQNRARRAGFKSELRTTWKAWKAWKNGAPGRQNRARDQGAQKHNMERVEKLDMEHSQAPSSILSMSLVLDPAPRARFWCPGASVFHAFHVFPCCSDFTFEPCPSSPILKSRSFSFPCFPRFPCCSDFTFEPCPSSPILKSRSFSFPRFPCWLFEPSQHSPGNHGNRGNGGSDLLEIEAGHSTGKREPKPQIPSFRLAWRRDHPRARGLEGRGDRQPPETQEQNL